MSIIFLIPVVVIIGSNLDMIIKYPDIILLNVLLLMMFAILLAGINLADIAARIYYKRHIKGKTYKELKKKQR